MQADKLVSVVVLSYNHAAFVRECLESVLAQTFDRWELIVADDASTDNSVSVINEWIAAQQITVRTNFHQKNTGIGVMLNECIELCRGEYIKFIAADDVLHPLLLEKAIGFFAQNDAEYGVVFSNAQYINEHSELQQKTIIPQGKAVPQGWIRKELQTSNFIPAPAVVIRKAVYQTAGYYDPSIKIDDYDCWLRASVYFKFHYIDEPLVYYRIHGNNISHTIDFNNDMIGLLIRNDRQGDCAQGIKQRLMDRYYQGNTKLPVLSEYAVYPYRDKWLYFCMKAGLPYRFFRLADKIFK